MEEREARLGVAVGKKGVGKTHSTMEDLLIPYVKGTPLAPGRKVLILDVNNEYMNIKAIAPENVKYFSAQRVIEGRRIRPLRPDGQPMTTDEFAQVLFDCLFNFREGLLLIEDPNLYISDNMPNDIIGALCTQRHKGVDIIMHYQSIGRITPKVWQNMNWLRFHKNSDSVERHKNKFPDKYELFSIAENIVNYKFFEEENTRFYCFVDIDHLKIRDNSKFLISEDIKDKAISEFLINDDSAVKKMMKTINPATNQKYTPEAAYKFVVAKLKKMYF